MNTSRLQDRIILTLYRRLRGLRLPPTYTEKDEYGCVRTFSCLLCPEALNTIKELEEHVVKKKSRNAIKGHNF